LAAEEVIILAGGPGTRLREAVPDQPKVMAPAGGKPFLAWLLINLYEQGARRCILSLGYRADSVLDYLGAATDLPKGLSVETVVEPAPLGTGGALRFALEQTGLRGRIVVLNGDTYLPSGYAEMMAAEPAGDAEIGLVSVEDVSRFGAVLLDSRGRVSQFAEKRGTGPGLIYAGICRLESWLLAAADTQKYSFEVDVLAKLSSTAQLHARRLSSPFVDIGVPSDYKRFQDLAVADSEPR